MIATQPNLFNAPPTLPDTDQRYTPQIWRDRIKRALGGSIDIDPTAAPDPAQHFARMNITEAMNCFSEQGDWFHSDAFTRCEYEGVISTAFMNPPYSGTAPFLGEWFYHFGDYRLTGITLTLPGVKNNKATQPILKNAINAGILQAACDPFGRINFNNGGKSNNRDSLFLFWDSTGDAASLTRFCEEFEQHGLISYFKPMS